MKAARWVTIGLVAALVVGAVWMPRADAARWWKLAWTLDTEVTPAKRVSVDEPGAGATLYTYVTYTITNRSLRDVDIVPLVSLVTDTHKTYYAQTVPAVKALIERKEGAALKSNSEMMGPINRGGTRRGVAIFRNVDLTAKRWDIYLEGLSGEYALQLIPGRADPLILYKTYHVEIRNVGDEYEPRDSELERVRTEWTYR